MMELLKPLHPWIAVGATLAVFAVLQLRRRAPIDLIFLGALLLVTFTGIITPQEAFAGFANPAVLTIAALLVVAAGLRSSGVLDWVGRALLGNVRTEKGALWRLAITLCTTSAFLLNTALVAMMAPVIIDWCRRVRISPSRVMIPLSYLTILGGVCSLIGTSTTLVINGQLRNEYQQRQTAALDPAVSTSGDIAHSERESQFTESLKPMDLFEIGRVGLPCALVGVFYLLTFGKRLLPNRTDMLEQLGDQRREYLVEMLVQPICPLVGKTVEQAGLRQLPGLFLIEIDRDGDIITPVAPHDVVHANDRFIFTGIVSTIVDLEKIPGLVPAADTTYEFHPKTSHQRRLTEVVLSRTSPLIGSTIREANFRRRYNAAVVAVHRNGVRLTNKVGDIKLEPGDTLLLQTRTEFVTNYRNSRDFYLVSGVEGAEPRRHDKAAIATFWLGLLVAWLVAASLFDPQQTWGALSSSAAVAMAIAVAMVVTRCLPISEARNSFDFQTLVTIGAALGLGLALSNSGAAEGIASWIFAKVGDNPFLLLTVLYLLTLVFTEMITNNAVAAMLFPLAVQIALVSGHNPRPFVMAVALAASLSFITPIGYQTNLMVMGPGGYRASDYFRCGAPLAALLAITALLLIPQIWPF